MALGRMPPVTHAQLWLPAIMLLHTNITPSLIAACLEQHALQAQQLLLPG